MLVAIAAAVAAHLKGRQEAAEFEFRSWSVEVAETVEEADGGQKWEHQHGLMFEPLLLWETCLHCRRLSRMPHAEVASLRTGPVVLKLLVELAEVSVVAQRHTRLIAGRSTCALCAMLVIRKSA